MNNTVKQKMSKTMDMRFYWLQDRVDQGMFRVYWVPGKENLGDYYMKKFAPANHKNVRPIYLYIKDCNPATLQGCVEIQAALQLCAIENKTKTHKPATKPANLPVTQLTNLERLYNSRIQLPAAAAAMVRLVNRISNKTCTQLS